MKWLRWLFRRGKRGTLLLNMAPGDSTKAMIVYQDWLVVLSERGEIWMINRSGFASPGETADVVAYKVRS